MLTPNLPLDKAVALTAAGLRACEYDCKDRGLRTAASWMIDAAKLLEQMLALHKGLVEREEKLTAEILPLREAVAQAALAAANEPPSRCTGACRANGLNWDESGFCRICGEDGNA